MRFISDRVSVKEPIVKLTVDDTRKDGRVFLKANGKTIMGFQDGEYCLYTDAGYEKVAGLKFTEDYFLQQHEGIF